MTDLHTSTEDSHPQSSRSFTSDTAILLYLATASLIVHLLTNATGGYGYFRDELYYVACSEHLDFGYVDHPPLSMVLLAVSRLMFGESLFALRLFPALAGGVTVLLTGWMARELGGRRFAQVLASIGAIISPAVLVTSSFYSMNSFDLLLWALTAYVLIRLIKTELSKYWILLGIVLGLGLLNKIGVLWLGFGVFVGLLFTPQRKWLKTPLPWVAGAIALGFFLPYVIWNAMHDWAHLEFIRNATSGKYSSLTPLSFIARQFLMQNPVTAPLWLAGLFFLFATDYGKRFRWLGIIYAAAFAILVLNQHSKAEYRSVGYPMLFSAGGVALERWTSRKSLGWIRFVYPPILLIGGILLAPFVMPVLPVETYIKYADAIGIAPSTPENKRLEKLPQFYADMFGWREKAEAVARVYHSLTPEEQAKCAIFADNYGRSAAIDVFRKELKLPPALGRHNNYWIWGPRGYTGELVIVLGGDLEDKQQTFGHVEVADTVSSEYCMPYENNLRIYVCRNLNIPLAEFWTGLKHFD